MPAAQPPAQPAAQPAARTPHEVLEHYHRALVSMSADDLADLYAPDATHEFPFPFPGMPSCYKGREEVRAGFRAAWQHSPATPAGLRDVTVHPTADATVLIAEQTVTGTVATTGEPFAFPGILVLHVEDGRITRVRDYMDALTITRTLRRDPGPGPAPARAERGGTKG
ncbi:nuclear transport factor 2 family protein [Kitasatospora phosalacinea]|uniref:Nuclear transport factor 2 family protein n=1 Tax=Kitasatospora phosalacinea TaxID=2065 RepID=A0ABW6GVJ8_9ACTN